MENKWPSSKFKPNHINNNSEYKLSKQAIIT